MADKVTPQKLVAAIQGLLKPGTLDRQIHERVKNPDGSISTVRTMSFNEGYGEVVIPTVFDGAVHSDEEAIDRYHKTGKSFGVFDSVDSAVKFSKQLHEEHEKQLRGKGVR